MKLSSFNYLMKQGVRGIWKNKLMSFASFFIMLVSLVMVGMSIMTTINLNRIIEGIAEKNEVVIVISDGVSQDSIDTLGTQLRDTPNVSEVNFYSKEDALENMKQSMPSEQQDLFIYFDSNPLPDTYRIRISDIAQIKETTDKIQNYQNVSSVKVPNDFADVLVSIRTIATILSTALIIILVIVCLVIISNTTRTSVFTRRKEINIMKYVGATNSFIRVPFFIEGMTLGILSAATALVITKVAYDALYKILTSNVTLQMLLGVKNIIPFNNIILYVCLAYLAAGVFLGAFGTVASTRKHLKV